MSNQALKNFFDIILKGESKSYNDYNYYICVGSLSNCLRSFLYDQKYGKKYPDFDKLTDLTIDQIMDFQDRSRKLPGQLFAVGRYQIIPDTLEGLVNTTKINVNTKFTPDVQDQLGYTLLMGRKNLRNYLKKTVEDNKKNLEAAALDVAKIWSSVGIPFDLPGKPKNTSYYAKGGDKASVMTEPVQASLRALRNGIDTPGTDKAKPIGLIFLLIGLGSYFFFKRQRGR
jgi:hypothetical protein